MKSQLFVLGIIGEEVKVSWSNIERYNKADGIFSQQHRPLDIYLPYPRPKIFDLCHQSLFLLLRLHFPPPILPYT